uniref:CNNM transmembrane domain-containing protein n=1 Tax=Parascaris univalens TaxID=6257 RepID=A0A915A6R4_PARUN
MQCSRCSIGYRSDDRTALHISRQIAYQHFSSNIRIENVVLATLRGCTVLLLFTFRAKVFSVRFSFESNFACKVMR